MSVALNIRNPTRKELADVLIELNREFVFSKHRVMPLEERFPGLFGRRNLHNLFGVFLDDCIVSFVAAKPVTIVFDDREISAFLIGSVFTASNFRGKGYSSQLMNHVQEHYLSLGMNVGILWTNQHEFYVKLGWISADNGVLVTCTLPTEIGFARGVIKVEELDDKFLPKIDLLRASSSKPIIKRVDNDYYDGFHTVYSPGEELIRLVSFDENNEITGYLLGSASACECFVYEINTLHSDDAIKLEFLNYIYRNRKFGSVNINLSREDSLLKGLQTYCDNVRTQATSIQMIFSRNGEISSDVKNLYVSFADRI